MRLGVVFPQTEIGGDPAAIRDYAQAAESLGYDHLLAYDHVLGTNGGIHKLNGPYTHTDMFHEAFVLYGYLAAVTQKLEFVTGIMIGRGVARRGALCGYEERPRHQRGDRSLGVHGLSFPSLVAGLGVGPEELVLGFL